MIYAGVAVCLFVWGVLVGRAIRMVGTVLAIIPVLVWFGLLASLGWPRAIDASGNELPVYLMVGMLAFSIGVGFGERRSGMKASRPDDAEPAGGARR